MKEPCWTDGPEVALKDMLLARERRVRRREDGLAHYRMPTIHLFCRHARAGKIMPHERITRQGGRAGRA